MYVFTPQIVSRGLRHDELMLFDGLSHAYIDDATEHIFESVSQSRGDSETQNSKMLGNRVRYILPMPYAADDIP